MTIPTFSELYNSILTDLRNRLAIRFIVGKLVLNAFAAVQAAKLKIMYLLGAKIYKNIFIDTAESEEVGGSLERYGRVKLGRDPFPATAGEYTLNVSGEVSATIAAGTTWKSGDNSKNPGKIYILDTLFTFTATTGTISIRALDLGPEAQLNIDDELQVTAPIGNVDSFGTIASEDVAPTEQESFEDYRNAVIQAYQFEPQGGAKTDYRLWAQDAAGVKNSFPYVTDGEPGKINLFIEATEADSTDGKGTPSQAILDEVEEVVEYDPDTTKPDSERGRRPMGTFEIFFLPIEPIAVDVEIVNLTDTGLLTTIQDAIKSFLLDVRPFVDGADNPNLKNKDKLYAADVVEIVRVITGTSASFDNVIMKVDTNIVQLYQFENGDIPFINSVTATI
jgi:hypothetical protein